MAVFFVVGLGVLSIIVLTLQAQSRADRWNSVYRELAQRYNGMCQSAGWFGRPSVRFRYGATHALVNTQTAGSAPFTQALISWPDHEIRVEISPQPKSPTDSQTGKMRPGTFRGMEDVYVDSLDFNQSYLVRSNNPRAARELLNEGVQWQIEKLRRFLRSDDVYISIHRGRILIKKPSHIRRIEELDEFTQLALALYDQGMLTRSFGIDFIEGGEAQLIQEAMCRVCGEEILTDMVFCRRCKTPHHQECWQYYGACSTYGCRETRFVAPRVASPHRIIKEDSSLPHDPNSSRPA